MQDSENIKTSESPEVSQTTGSSTAGSSGSSTGDSTGLVEPIQPADLDAEPTVIEAAELEEVSLMKDGTIEAGIKKYCPKCGAVLTKPIKQKGKGIYQRKGKITHWLPEEQRKIYNARSRREIFKFYYWFAFSKKEAKNRAGAEYFAREFPARSPVAVYQKAWRVKSKKEVKKPRIN